MTRAQRSRAQDAAIELRRRVDALLTGVRQCMPVLSEMGRLTRDDRLHDYVDALGRNVLALVDDVQAIGAQIAAIEGDCCSWQSRKLTEVGS